MKVQMLDVEWGDRGLWVHPLFCRTGVNGAETFSERHVTRVPQAHQLQISCGIT